ncbi:hypothetical protein LJK88_24220 [Paenibacillus sp. P26]|nr:hypothetical protein LJK88_24220 [Paenibacillus sp. P26]UUZ95415.1 hypothetical protein LJK87_13680 [Paenibacillus sp. P25]
MYHPGPQQTSTSTAAHRLAPHETLELHELLASKNVHLYNMKKTLPQLTDPELRQIYLESIHVCEAQIRELAQLLQRR